VITLKIKKYRILRNISQKELANRTGLTQQYISELEKENRTKSPTLHTIEIIAAALGVGPLDLLHYHNNDNFF
jgi:transcriptional regulator with XRE-family HTH domain